MNTWYKFILNALFSKKTEDKDWKRPIRKRMFFQITLNWTH